MDDGPESNMPIGYILMMGKAEQDYVAALQFIKSTVEDATTRTMSVRRILVDYEVAIWKALRTVLV